MLNIIVMYMDEIVDMKTSRADRMSTEIVREIVEELVKQISRPDTSEEEQEKRVREILNAGEFTKGGTKWSSLKLSFQLYSYRSDGD